MIQYDQFTAMSTSVVLAGQSGPDPAGLARVREGFAQVRALVERREEQFSRFRETSELSALNRAAGTWFNASPELFTVMRKAYELFQATGGLFNPAILDALEKAGYDATIDVVRTRSQVGNIVMTMRREGVADFGTTAFDLRQCAIWLAPGTRVDLGGIAKGWIAQEAAERLAEFCSACAVSAGGDLFAIGTPEGERGWEVALEDPHDPEKNAAVLCVPAGAVATSAVTRRRWKQGTAERHHLIDPRTGEPAVTDWLSVTVIADEAAVAEVMAKSLLLAGPSEAGALAREQGVEFIAIDRNSKLWGTAGAGDYEWKN